MLTEKALAALEEQLLAAPIREAAAKARRDALETKPHISAEAAEIVSEEQAENGNVVLETKQQVTREDMDESGEAKQTTSESRARYSCVKGEDGKWRITQLERAIRDRRTGKSGWQTWTGMAGNAYAALTERFPEPEVLKQDTEESAARSLFCSLLATDVACRRRTEAVTIAAFLKELEPLLTTDFIAAAKQTGDDNAGGSTTMPRFEIESAKTDADGRAVIQFKQTESWRNLVQLTLEQANNKWRVVSAATSDPPSEDGQEPSYEPVVNMYDLRTP
ncbi:MAG: hypothetical protein H6841_10895 [Planctomycetes bacterium]|nr:hypothetical protein [Planctomycetota bacterium]MCB9935812.1 hypothetical protein [Planctomycetota bacterium]